MYYVIEFDTRGDGVINTSITGRSTFAGAVSYYHERYSKAAVSTDFVSVSIMLVDANLEVKDSATIETQYKAPEETNGAA